MWYLAIATAEAAQETFKLDFLAKGNYTMVLLEEDGKGGFRRTERPVAAEDLLPLDLLGTEEPSPASSADNEKST